MKCKKMVLVASTLLLTNPANAALLERLNGLAFYDDEANLTWLANANTAGIAMNWIDANSWAANLDVAGTTGWRLPINVQVDATCSGQGSDGVSSGFNCTGSELGNMFYNVLGGVAQASITTTHNANYNVFSNIQPDNYWTNTTYDPFPSNAMGFGFATGNQGHAPKSLEFYAWAVQSGDVGTAAVVPVPAAFWLFGSGLLGLTGVARRKKA